MQKKDILTLRPFMILLFRKLWMNQIVLEGFQIGIVNKFLRSLDVVDDIEFIDYNQYNNLIMDCMEECDSEKLEFLLEYGHTKKGFPTFKIEEVYAEE